MSAIHPFHNVVAATARRVRAQAPPRALPAYARAEGQPAGARPLRAPASVRAP